MEIKFKDKKLAKLLKAKKEAVDNGLKMSKEAREMQENLNRLKLKKDNLVEKIHNLVEKKDFELPEFVELNEVLLVDGEIVITTIDVIEDYKKIYRQNQKENKKKDKKK